MARRRTNAGVRIGYLVLAGGMLLMGSGCVSSFSTPPSSLAAKPAFFSGDPLAMERLRQQARARAQQSQLRREAAQSALMGGSARSMGGRGAGMPGALPRQPTPGAPAFSDPIVTPVYLKSYGSVYHFAGCSWLQRGDLLVIDQKNALDYGFTACSECGGGSGLAGRKRGPGTPSPNLPAFR